MDRTTLTAALKPLERRGLVKIAQDPNDRRSRILILTDKGRTLLARALPVWQRTHEQVEAAAPSVDWAALRRNLLAIS
jgi:DNA-binding MarR family transcriptional regulator